MPDKHLIAQMRSNLLAAFKGKAALDGKADASEKVGIKYIKTMADAEVVSIMTDSKLSDNEFSDIKNKAHQQASLFSANDYDADNFDAFVSNANYEKETKNKKEDQGFFAKLIKYAKETIKPSVENQNDSYCAENIVITGNEDLQTLMYYFTTVKAEIKSGKRDMRQLNYVLSEVVNGLKTLIIQNKTDATKIINFCGKNENMLENIINLLSEQTNAHALLKNEPSDKKSALEQVVKTIQNEQH